MKRITPWAAAVSTLLSVLMGCNNYVPEPARCGAETCTGCCQRSHPEDPGTCVTPVTISACGSDGLSCSVCADGQSCTAGSCVDVADSLPVGAGHFFITNAQYTGDLGGIAGADAKCQAAATSAALPGVFRAWISDLDERTTPTRPRVDAIDRITAQGPWYLPCRDEHKKLIKAFANHAQLETAPLTFTDCTELGGLLVKGQEKTAWTGTAAGGTAKSQRAPEESSNCDGWSTIDVGKYGTRGISTTTPSDWTDVIADPCAFQAHLYCFQN